MLFALMCVFSVLLSSTFTLFIMPGTRGYKSSPLKMGAIGMREPDG